MPLGFSRRDMNAIIKKEIRLLLPAFVVAVLLAMVQAITRPYDFYVASLLFFGLTIMALSSIGRETGLNTFSSLLSQPAERIRIWQIKLSVLTAAFLAVFVVWLAAYGIAYHNSNVDESDRGDSYNLFITICLIGAATFTGGLWTTLLLRQVASAFWLTLLVPATLSGVSAIFLANAESSSLVIAVLSLVIGIYSIAGFLFARRLYFRAQDVGWSGGVITLPEWKLFAARAKSGDEVRRRRPIFALLKKELLLQQGVLTGAAGLLVMHVGIILLRIFHHFPKDSAGEALTSIFGMLWLVLPVIVGGIAVAEERSFEMIESQLCLPVSRRVQFVIKACMTLLLGLFLGGVMPLAVEIIGTVAGTGLPVFTAPVNNSLYFLAGLMGGVGWLVLCSFFGSSLAKNFLQAMGFGVATFFGCMLLLPIFTRGWVLGLDHASMPSILVLIIAVPTLIVTLLWLAYLNFKDFQVGWLMGRRILFGISVALLFIFISSNTLYRRAWEVFEPAEPAHSPAKLSLANPPYIQAEDLGKCLSVQLPDGRYWFDRIGNDLSGHFLRDWIRYSINPFPVSVGPQQYISGSNWVGATVRYYIYGLAAEQTNHFVYLETIGIKSDGTLWISEKSNTPLWTGDRMIKFGEETNWKALAWPIRNRWVFLLKKDGTLWEWGTNQPGNAETPGDFSLRDLKPYRIGTNSDWIKISHDNRHLQKADGSLWAVWENPKSGRIGTVRDTNWDNVDLDKIPPVGSMQAYVRKDGTLWFREQEQRKNKQFTSETFPVGKETNWVAAALAGWDRSEGMMVALKSDGTLWQPRLDNENALPTRLGIHNDWVALSGTSDGVVSLAADGSLWLWPYREALNEQQLLIKLPKQPQFLGNVLKAAD